MTNKADLEGAFAESAETAGVSYERLLDRIIGLGRRWAPARIG